MNKPVQAITVSPEESARLFKKYYDSVVFVDDDGSDVISYDYDTTDEDGDPKEEITLSLKGLVQELTETKVNVVRRVRTMDGVRKYGLPIGSIIVTDTNPSVAAGLSGFGKFVEDEGTEASVFPPKRVVKKKKTMPTSFDIPTFSIEEGGEGEDGSFLYILDKKLGYAIVYRKNQRFFYYSLLDNKGKLVISDKPASDGKFYPVIKKPIQMPRSNLHNTEDIKREARKKMHLLAKKPYIEDVYEAYSEATPIHENTWDIYDGIYGIDWVFDGEEPVTIDDLPGRVEYQDAELEELGIEFQKAKTSMYDIDIDAADAILGAARILETKIEGFSALQPLYLLKPSLKDSTIAANGLIYYHSDIGLKKNPNPTVENPRLYPHSVIELSADYFSDYYDETKLKHTWDFPNRQYSWHSVNAIKESKENDTPIELVRNITTIMHESGHTIGNIITGRWDYVLKVQRGKESGMPPTYNDLYKTNDGYMSEYLPRLLKIFGKWGLMNPDIEVPNQVQNVGVLENAIILFDKTEVASLLSEYGSTNIHEFLAECWADYMMSTNPKPISIEVGELMVEAARAFIKKEVK